MFDKNILNSREISASILILVANLLVALVEHVNTGTTVLQW